MAIATAALVLAFLISYLVTPVIRRLAVRFDFVDRPDGQRKIQRTPVSLGGGLSLLVATPIAVGLLMLWWGGDLWLMARMPTSLLGLIVGTLLLAIVGVIDDGVGMAGSQKLLWQVVAACLVMGSGFSIPRITLFNIEIPLAALRLGSVFTVVWLLGAINSLNLIDGVDGLAGSVGVVFSLTFGSMALLGDQYLDAIVAFALAGSLLGFLRYNFAPATIYLGDTGSMIVGFVLGTIALRCSMKQAATLAFATPLAIWSIPMFDSIAALTRRLLTGRSLYATDRGHIHHVLLTKMKPAQAVGLIVALCSVTSVGAVASLYLNSEWIGIATVLCVLGYLICTKLFGHSEMLLLNSRLIGFGQHFTGIGARRQGNIRQTQLTLQGTGRWEELWGALVESAERFHVVKMRLNLSLPRLHEDFFATWQQAGSHRRELLWQTDIPLVVDGMPVGRLCVTGLQFENSASREINQFIDFVESLESQLAILIQQGLSTLPGGALSTPPGSQATDISDSELATQS